MDISTMIGKTFNFVLMQNASYDEIEGEVSASDFGDDVLHVTDSDDEEYEIPASAVAAFYETEEETENVDEKTAEETEAEQEEKFVKDNKDKYSNRSVNDIPTKKKKGWLGI